MIEIRKADRGREIADRNTKKLTEEEKVLSVFLVLVVV